MQLLVSQQTTSNKLGDISRSFARAFKGTNVGNDYIKLCDQLPLLMIHYKTFSSVIII